MSEAVAQTVLPLMDSEGDLEPADIRDEDDGD